MNLLGLPVRAALAAIALCAGFAFASSQTKGRTPGILLGLGWNGVSAAASRRRWAETLA